MIRDFSRAGGKGRRRKGDDGWKISAISMVVMMNKMMMRMITKMGCMVEIFHSAAVGARG